MKKYDLPSIYEVMEEPTSKKSVEGKIKKGSEYTMGKKDN